LLLLPPHHMQGKVETYPFTPLLIILCLEVKGIRSVLTGNCLQSWIRHGLSQDKDGNLETRILRELTSPSSFQWNFRESYAAMGRRLGADEETVRATLGRSVRMGLVQKWRLILNPELLGGGSGECSWT
jgi:hypothetical protein